ncbi:MAG: glucoamylase family protein [bacterium]
MLLLLLSCRTPSAGLGAGGVDISRMSDDDFIDRVEHDSVMYYVENAHPISGLIMMDRKRTHVGSNGFGLIALCIGAERKWIAREDAAGRVLKILRTFRDVADRHDGAFLWITDAKTAHDNSYRGSYDIVETSFVCAGALVCKQYFDGPSETEQAIRHDADVIYQRVRYDAFQDDGKGGVLNTLAWGCDYATGKFGDFRVMGYNEGMIVYIMALGSPTYPASTACWDGWASTYLWKETYGQSYFFCPALFTHQYSQAWLDLRDVQDRYTREKGITYFENTRRAALSHLEYARQNPKGMPGYGPVWGLTDCGCPLHPGGYGGHGLPWGNGAAPADDDGTIAVTAAGASIPFTPKESIAFLRHVYTKFGDRIYDRHGFRSAFNEEKNWFDPKHDGVNKGAFVALLENYRSGLVWKLFMRNPEIQDAMAKAGFQKAE